MKKILIVIVICLLTAGAALVGLRYQDPRIVAQSVAAPTPTMRPDAWKIAFVYGPPTLQESKKMPNPTVPQGGSNTFPFANSTSGAGSFYEVYDSGSLVTILATASFNVANNGWTVDFDGSDFTVTAPPAQTIAINYTVIAYYGGGQYDSLFDIVAGAPPTRRNGRIGALLNQQMRQGR